MKRTPIQFKAGPGEGLETKHGDARLEVKAEGEGGILHIKAYALAFGNIDSWGDIIMPGALDDFLKSADADRMALCYQHERRTVIGKITDKGVDDYGMWIEADILPPPPETTQPSSSSPEPSRSSPSATAQIATTTRIAKDTSTTSASSTPSPCTRCPR